MDFIVEPCFVSYFYAFNKYNNFWWWERMFKNDNWISNDDKSSISGKVVKDANQYIWHDSKTFLRIFEGVKNT